MARPDSRLRLAQLARGLTALALVLASSLAAAAPAASADDEDNGPNPNDARARSLNALVGAETGDQGIQALAFLPNDVSANVGDQITWSFPTHEPHTLTFVPAGQPRPPASAPATPSGGTLDGTKLINSGALLGGATYTVKLGASGDFAFVCLIHGRMSDTLHVQPAGSPREDEDGSLVGQGRQQGRQLLRSAASSSRTSWPTCGATPTR
jgi:plastocyanin